MTNERLTSPVCRPVCSAITSPLTGRVSSGLALPAPSLYYACEEASGNLVDLVGGKNLTAVNAPGSGAGKIGNGRTLVAASSQGFTRADEAVLRFGNQAWTFGCWLNHTSNGDAHIIVAKMPQAPTGEMQSYINVAGRVYADVRKSGFSVAASLTNTTVLATGVWNLVLMRYSTSSTKLGISINGAAFQESAAATGDPVTSGLAFAVGQLSDNSFYFPGTIDEVFKINGTAFTDEQAALLYNGGVGARFNGSIWVAG